MSPTEPDQFPDGDDDYLAAEFVLAVLPLTQHDELARRAQTDPAFARMVIAWQDRLFPLADHYVAVDPPPAVKRALDLRLFGQASPQRSATVWGNLGLWRGLTGVMTAAFLAVVALPYLPFYLAPSELAQPRLIASLMTPSSDVHYLALYDPAGGMVTLTHVAGARVSGRDFQLWIARGSDAPVSLGVIPVGTSVQIALNDQSRALIGPEAHLAISVEPEGGSPTGQPTGAVVAVGDLYQA